MKPRPKHDPLRAARLAEHRRRMAELARRQRRLLAAAEARLFPEAKPAPPEEDGDGDDWPF